MWNARNQIVWVDPGLFIMTTNWEMLWDIYILSSNTNCWLTRKPSAGAKLRPCGKYVRSREWSWCDKAWDSYIWKPLCSRWLGITWMSWLSSCKSYLTLKRHSNLTHGLVHRLTIYAGATTCPTVTQDWSRPHFQSESVSVPRRSDVLPSPAPASFGELAWHTNTTIPNLPKLFRPFHIFN